MILFGFTVFAFTIFVLYEQFVKRDPLESPAPDDPPEPEYTEYDGDREPDPIWDPLSETEKKAKLDKQLDDYYANNGRKVMLAWAYLFGYNKGKADKQN